MEELEPKLKEIRSKFSTLLGAEIIQFQTAEIGRDDDTWDPWPDLPIRIITAHSGLIAISWSRFDDLWLSSDLSLPFATEGSLVRWMVNSIPAINPAIGATMRSVHLGRGEMSIEGTEIEIWTRLLIETDKGWIEVFNALDENGYDFHTVKPSGEFVFCV